METTRRDLLKGAVAIPIAGAIAVHLPPAAAATPAPSAPPVVKAPKPPPIALRDVPEIILSGDYPLFRFADGTVVNFVGARMNPHTFPDGVAGYYDTYFGCFRLLDATITDESGAKVAEAGWGMKDRLLGA